MANTNAPPSLSEMQAQLHLLAHKIHDLEGALAKIRKRKHSSGDQRGDALATPVSPSLPSTSSAQALPDVQGHRQLYHGKPNPSKRKERLVRDAATQTGQADYVLPAGNGVSTDGRQAGGNDSEAGGDAGSDGAGPSKPPPPLRTAVAPPRRGIHNFGLPNTTLPSLHVNHSPSSMLWPGIMPDRGHNGWLDDNFLADKSAMGRGRGATLGRLPPLPPLPWLPPLPPLLRERSYPLIACGPGIRGPAGDEGGNMQLPLNDGLTDSRGYGGAGQKERFELLGYPLSAEVERILRYAKEREDGGRGADERSEG